MAKKYLRRSQVAEKLNIGERTVDKWVKRGLLPEGIKVGRAKLYDDEQIDQYLDKLRAS